MKKIIKKYFLFIKNEKHGTLKALMFSLPSGLFYAQVHYSVIIIAILILYTTAFLLFYWAKKKIIYEFSSNHFLMRVKNDKVIESGKAVYKDNNSTICHVFAPIKTYPNDSPSINKKTTLSIINENCLDYETNCQDIDFQKIYDFFKNEFFEKRPLLVGLKVLDVRQGIEVVCREFSSVQNPDKTISMLENYFPTIRQACYKFN